MRLKNRLREMSQSEREALSERLSEVLSDLLREEPKAYFVVSKSHHTAPVVKGTLAFNDADKIEIFRFENAVLLRRVM